MWKTGASPGIPRDLRPQAIVDKLTLVHRGILPNRVGTDFHRIISTVNSRCGKYFVCTKREEGREKVSFFPFLSGRAQNGSELAVDIGHDVPDGLVQGIFAVREGFFDLPH